MKFAVISAILGFLCTAFFCIVKIKNPLKLSLGYVISLCLVVSLCLLGSVTIGIPFDWRESPTAASPVESNDSVHVGGNNNGTIIIGDNATINSPSVHNPDWNVNFYPVPSDTPAVSADSFPTPPTILPNSSVQIAPSLMPSPPLVNIEARNVFISLSGGNFDGLSLICCPTSTSRCFVLCENYTTTFSASLTEGMYDFYLIDDAHNRLYQSIQFYVDSLTDGQTINLKMQPVTLISAEANADTSFSNLRGDMTIEVQSICFILPDGTEPVNGTVRFFSPDYSGSPYYHYTTTEPTDNISNSTYQEGFMAKIIYDRPIDEIAALFFVEYYGVLYCGISCSIAPDGDWNIQLINQLDI